MTDLPVTAPTLQPGTRLGEDGRYRLTELLGAGGMASVWSAYDERLGRKVAVKIISDTLALDPDFVARFEREAYLAGGMSHPHVVQIFDYGTWGNRPFLVMDHVGGGTLEERMKAEVGQWDPVLLACELLDALNYIHASGVLHRDLKPANVLIGSDGHARLTDFGIAQLADTARLTDTGLLLGTAEYVAPEVMHGQPPSVRSDLYALGILLRRCAPHAPALAPVINALTQADPEQRPADAAEALALLSRPSVVADPPTVPLPAAAPPPPPPPRAVSPSPPRGPSQRGLRLVMATLLGAIAALIAVMLILMARQDSGGAGPSLPGDSGTVAERLDQLDVLIDQSRR